MSIDWFTFIAQIVNFVVLVMLLNHFLYRPLTDAIAKREADTADRINAAENEKQAALELKLKYESFNQEIEDRRQSRLEQINAESESTRDRLMKEARDEVQFRREEWMKSMRQDQNSLVNQVSEKSFQQAITISKQVLRMLADEDLEQKTLDRFLEHLTRIPEDDKNRLRRESNDTNAVSTIETAFEVSTDWKQKIRNLLLQEFNIRNIEFVTNPEIILGANLRIGGLKTGFDVGSYAQSLQDELQQLLQT